jgi:hypothetical protein
MKSNFKQYWSTIPPKLTKEVITSHLNTLNTKKIMAYDIENPGLGLGQAPKYGRVKPVNGIPNHPS